METICRIYSYYPPFLFKSYYVVWKPPREKKEEVGEEGLNRTMQYGNTNKNIKTITKK